MSLKIGDIGHLFVLLSFVACTIAAYSYFFALKFQPVSREFISWQKFARISFYVHAVSVAGIIYSLFFIIYNHRYEYYYAYDHSSNELPVYYMISCFWEGQEGSFLLWIFWHAALGVILIRVNKLWEPSVMAVFCLVQAFLASMILGVVIPWINIKIGSSPFVLFKEQMPHLPVFKIRPDFVPENGEGLNALLQNYWMVIHPPTLFLGFAATTIPFVYCIAGLLQKKYREWIRPALPWALFAAMILGTGILMGGYWAYETLNFGGYWNWDPVENAVYVPWLILVASIHTMISYKNSGAALKSSMILVISSFLMILYATFLTRSGVLGNASIHSFTDLGLSGQLGLYLGTFILISLILVIIRWNEFPASQKEAEVYSREFWIFVGAAVLCLAALHVTWITSFPFFNLIGKSVGLDLNLALPADKETYFSNRQIWFAILIAILSGIGQFFWWKKIEGKKVKDAIAIPLILALLVSIVIMILGGTYDWDKEIIATTPDISLKFLKDWFGLDTDMKISGYMVKKIRYILLITASLFSIFANSIILVQVVRNNFRLSGGAVSHIGLAMMLIGILYSSGYSKVVSLNMTGLLLIKDAPVDYNRDNILLWRNVPEKMNGMELSYRGPRVEAKGFPGYVNKDSIIMVPGKYKALARTNISAEGKIYFRKGDSLDVSPENTFYEVLFRKDDGDTFKLYPRLQVNPQMGTIASPDIKRFFSRDLYAHVNSMPVNEEDRKWSEPEQHVIKEGDTLFLNDFVAILEDIKGNDTIPGIRLKGNDVSVTARIKILGSNNKVYYAKPSYIVLLEDKMVGQIPEIIEDLGLKISFLHIDPQTNSFTFGVNTSQKDYIVLKAIEKPMINVLWIGTLLLVLGMIMAIVRRYNEFVKMRDKGEE
ncbi:MAG: cytochrome c biogenesis protein CcsA [Cytophagaceae bacterium]